MLRDKIQHPLESMGGAYGEKLDRKVGSPLGLENE